MVKYLYFAVLKQHKFVSRAFVTFQVYIHYNISDNVFYYKIMLFYVQNFIMHQLIVHIINFLILIYMFIYKIEKIFCSK